MKRYAKFLAVVFFAVAFMFGLLGITNAATQVNLGTASDFAVLGGSTVTNTGLSVITGDLGLFPGLAVTGFPPGTVSGTMHAGDATASQAQIDLTTAYNNAASQSCDHNLTGQDLGGMTLTPGTYCFDTSAQLTGTLTLNGEGNADAVFIFQIGSTLTTASQSRVSTINSAQACNVFWQIGSSATLGTNTQFDGSVLALTSITATTGANISGRLLARNGAVTLDDNDVEGAVCVGDGNNEDENESESEGENEDKNANEDTDEGTDGDIDEDDEDVDIKVTKKANPETLSGPGSVTYTYKVSNEGDVSLKDISVSDDKCSPLIYVSGKRNKDGKLDKNEIWKYTCTKKVFATETNKVTAAGTGDGNRVKDTAKAAVVVSSVPGFPSAGVGPDNDNLWNITSHKLFSFFLL